MSAGADDRTTSGRVTSVSIVIPAKNGRPTIGPCLDAVLAQELDIPFDVLVIDSGSTDGSLDDIRARPAVKLHRIAPSGFDHGDTRNLGAGMTTGQAIVFLVQDAEPVGRHWLAKLVRNLDDPRVAGAFSRILPRPHAGPLVKKGCEGDLCFGTQRIETTMESPEAWAALDPHMLRLRCNFNDVSSVLRRSVWERLPFERGMFGEDIKFTRAALEAGWTIVFDPESEVLHSHEYDAATVAARTFVDAELNQFFLGRTCIEKLSHVFVMTGRFWKSDRQYLSAQRLPLSQRLKWGAFSPYYHFKEFWGFWRGGRAVLDAPGGPKPGARPPAAVPLAERPLKILTVVHGFPPDSWAGTEVLSLTLGRGLRERGHDVAFFVRSHGAPGEADRSLHRSEFDGFRVHRFVNHLAFSGVDETYRFAPAEAAFDTVLAEERPDVVHCQHLIHLSTGIIDRCRVAGVPVVVSLSDYWARCSRVQLIRPDRSNCMSAPPGLGCAACVKDKPALIGPLATLDNLLGGLPLAWARKVPQTVPAHAPGWAKSREDAASLVRREHWMREVLLRADSVVVASRSVKRAMTGLGLPPGKIVLCEYGSDRSWCPDGPPARVPRAPGAPLRVGFLGSLVWYKGLHVAAQAVAAMPPGSVHLHVHGDHVGGSDPGVAAQFRAVADEARAIAGERISFHGRYPHDALAAIHAELDVIVVPSVWQEAYGLTVRETFLSRTPVVGSDIAGIAEGIEHDRTGLLFRTGDAESLRAALQRFLDEPELGARLTANAPHVRTGAEEAREMEWRYRQVISARGGLRSAAVQVGATGPSGGAAA